MGKYIVGSDRLQMTILRMRIACCIPKASNTDTKNVILIAVPLQQSLHETISLLRNRCIACLVIIGNIVYPGSGGEMNTENYILANVCINISARVSTQHVNYKCC